jgi:hypothetical protein
MLNILKRWLVSMPQSEIILKAVLKLELRGFR